MVRRGSFIPISLCQDAIPLNNSKMSAVWFGFGLLPIFYFTGFSFFFLFSFFSWSFTFKMCQHSNGKMCYRGGDRYCFKSQFYMSFWKKLLQKAQFHFDNVFSKELIWVCSGFFSVLCFKLPSLAENFSCYGRCQIINSYVCQSPLSPYLVSLIP